MILAAAVAVFAVAGDDGGEAGHPAPPADGVISPANPANNAAGDLPAAPWRAGGVPRADVPLAYVTAWERARNGAGCALLFPLDGGPALDGAEATEERTPEDRGWDISLTGPPGSVEVLGLFGKADAPLPRSDTPSFTRRWADGSVARYGADVVNAAPGTFDPNSSPFEAVLTLPDQSCAYRIYDTLGKDHLEYVFDRLRLMAP